MDLVLPCAAGASSVFAGFAFLYTKLRPHVPVTVNCWFCNEDLKVAFKDKNNFVCTSCQQYNGFSEDGDYNCEIAAQYCEKLNPVPQNQTTKLNPTNGFCENCNLNQALKVRALADYSAVSPCNYDKEVEEFRNRLERMYGLCQQCEAMLHQTLGMQNSWLKPKLIAWRLQQSKDFIIEAISQRVSHLPISVRMLMCILSTICSIFLAIETFSHNVLANYFEDMKAANLGIEKDHCCLSLVSMCILFHSSVLYWIGKQRYRMMDVFCCIVWIIILSLLLCRESLDEQIFNLVKISLTCIVFVLSLISANISRVSFQTEKLNRSAIRHASSPSSTIFDEQDVSINNSFEMNEEAVPPLCTSSSEVNRTSTAKGFGDVCDKIDLDTTFGGMQLGTPKKLKKGAQVSNSFTPKSIFSERPSSPSILAPSKLNSRFVNQNSWVAGGYWGVSNSPQRGILNQQTGPLVENPPRQSLNFDSLAQSRSSSQSSGFISQGAGSSTLMHSGQPSLFAEGDKASILLEQNNWARMPNEQTFNANYKINNNHPIPYYPVQSFSPPASICSEHSQFSPSLQSTCFFRDNSASVLQSNAGSVIGSQIVEGIMSRYLSPWMAFILGVSISANAFLLLILCKSDIF